MAQKHALWVDKAALLCHWWMLEKGALKINWDYGTIAPKIPRTSQKYSKISVSWYFDVWILSYKGNHIGCNLWFLWCCAELMHKGLSQCCPVLYEVIYMQYHVSYEEANKSYYSIRMVAICITLLLKDTFAQGAMPCAEDTWKNIRSSACYKRTVTLKSLLPSSYPASCEKKC